MQKDLPGLLFLAKKVVMQGQIQENRKGGIDARKACPLGHAPHPPEIFCIFYSLRLLLVHFQVKIQLKILTAIINSYQSCSNSNDPLNILHECCDTNLLMISFNYMSTKRGGSGPPGSPTPGSAPVMEGSSLGFFLLAVVYIQFGG